MRKGFGDRPRLETAPSGVRGAAADLARCLRFSSRLPIPALPWEIDPHAVPDLRALARMLPAAGALIGAAGALVLAGALAAGLGPPLSSAFAVAVLTLATGALHEDALADTADGFGGGATPERRLAIMKDSRIGSFGAAALALAVALRIAALATLAERLGLPELAGAMVVAGALSRAAALTVFALPPARREGASYAAAHLPAAGAVVTAWTVSGAIALGAAGLASLPLAGLALSFALAALIAFGITWLSARLIGGHTGDVAGAIQQASEIAALVGLVIAARP